MIKKKCPLKMTCKKTDENGEVVEMCRWWVELDGKNPNTGEVVKEGDCAVKWIPFLQIENTMRVSGVQEATESFRNEMVKSNDVALAIMASEPLPQLGNEQPKNLLNSN